MIRKPAVSGSFYKGTNLELKSEVKGYISSVVKKETVKAVICPHAGFVFSGSVAGQVYSKVEIPENVIILGPNHTGRCKPFSVFSKGVWEMPNGKVEINEVLAKKIIENSDYLEADEPGHVSEHSIEVQLPFLQFFRKNLKITPIIVSAGNIEIYKDIGTAIFKTLKDFDENVLIVSSTDMTHYESHVSAGRKDKEAIKYIENIDPEGLLNYVRSNDVSMCGVAPTTSVLFACQEMGATSSTLVDYMTSGNINGDYDHVVGYAGLIVN